MGLIKVDQRRTSQPQTQVLPAQRWLDRGLAIAISGNNSWGKYAGGRLQPLVDTGIVSAGDAGIGRRYASSGYGSYDAAWMKPRSSGSTGPTTIVCCYSMQSVVGTQRVMSLGYDGAGGGGMMISPSAKQQRVIINASGVNTVSNVGGALVAGETYITAGTISGTSLNAYHSDGAVTSGTGSVAWGATDFLRLATDDILSSYANVTVFGGYVFETALTKSDIDELMGNFHAVWKPRRIWVPVSAGGGGTTPVSSDQSLSWAVRSGAQADQSLAYPVKNAAQQDQPFAYPVKNAAQQSQSLAWTLRAGVQESRALSWALLNAAQSNRSLSYTLRRGVQQSHALTYPVSASILRQLDLSWSVLNSGTVVSTLPLTWLVRAGVLSSRSLAWALRSGVQRTHDLAWAILNSGTVTSQRSLSWLVRSAAQQPQTLAYPVRNAVQADRTIAYPVLTAAQSNLLIDYLVRAGVQVSFPLAYGVAGTVQNQLPLVWVVFSSGGVPELLCVNVESAFPFSALADSGFPDLRAAVTKAMTVCGDC